MPGVFQPSNLALNLSGFFLQKKIEIAKAIIKAMLVNFYRKIKK
jgi:hypothetical protein